MEVYWIKINIKKSVVCSIYQQQREDKKFKCDIYKRIKTEILGNISDENLQDITEENYKTIVRHK